MPGPIRMGYWPSLFGQDGWTLAKFFFCVFMDCDEVEVHKLAKKERDQYPTILTEQTWSIKDLLYGFRGNFSCGIQRVVPSGQDGQSQRAIWFILPARRASHIIIREYWTGNRVFWLVDFSYWPSYCLSRVINVFIFLELSLSCSVDTKVTLISTL